LGFWYFWFNYLKYETRTIKTKTRTKKRIPLGGGLDLRFRLENLETYNKSC